MRFTQWITRFKTYKQYLGFICFSIINHHKNPLDWSCIIIITIIYYYYEHYINQPIKKQLQYKDTNY